MSFMQNEYLVTMLKKTAIFLGLIAGCAHFQRLKNFERSANAPNFPKRIFGAFTVILASAVPNLTIATLLMPAKKGATFCKRPK